MYIQAMLLIHLALVDSAIKFHIITYEAKLNTLLERLNDVFVNLGSYYLLILTGFAQLSDNDKYASGWYIVILLGVMVTINTGTVAFGAIISFMRNLKTKCAKRRRMIR